MKIAFILGTRPEIMKLCPLIKLCDSQKIKYDVVHTGQHYDESLSDNFFKELKIKKPKFRLSSHRDNSSTQLGYMIIQLTEILQDIKPDVVIVQGDTRTVLAGSLVANALGIKLAHVEAGLRSFNREMPEEFNRIIADELSDYLFLPTKRQLKNLKNIKTKKFIVGNTISDLVVEAAKNDSKYHNQLLGLICGRYILLTYHRKENLTEKNLRSLYLICEHFSSRKYDIIFSIHPNTFKLARKYNINFERICKVINPVGYNDMISLIKNSAFVMTDSGGLQEEATILKKKCIILRNETERPEVLDVGGAQCFGTTFNAGFILKFDKLLKKKVKWYNPFGKNVSQKILKILKTECES